MNNISSKRFQNKNCIRGSMGFEVQILFPTLVSQSLTLLVRKIKIDDMDFQICQS